MNVGTNYKAVRQTFPVKTRPLDQKGRVRQFYDVITTANTTAANELQLIGAEKLPKGSRIVAMFTKRDSSGSFASASSAVVHVKKDGTAGDAIISSAGDPNGGSPTSLAIIMFNVDLEIDGEDKSGQLAVTFNAAESGTTGKYEVFCQYVID